MILTTGFQRADPLVSLLIAGLMVRSGAQLVRASGRIFLEAAPAGLDPQAIGTALVAQEGVVEVHDLHVWEVSSGFPALSAHVLVAADSDCHQARRRMEELLRERFGLDHTTLQVDHAARELSGHRTRGGRAPVGLRAANRPDSRLADLPARAHEHLVDAHVRPAARSRRGSRGRCPRPPAA